MKPTAEIQAIVKKTGLLWNPENGTRTGWYQHAGNFLGHETSKILNRHYNEWRQYFNNLAKAVDYEDWSIADQDLFDAVRELEQIVVPEEQQLLNDNEAFWCGLGGPYQE